MSIMKWFRTDKKVGAFVVIDGLEKAGKTYFIREFVKLMGRKKNFRKVRVFKWRKAQYDNYHEYLVTAEKQVKSWIEKGDLVVWDRSWLSELVYAYIDETPRLMMDNWEMEGFLLNRFISTFGRQYVFLGPDLETVKKNRDASDLPIEPEKESELFQFYGDWFGWDIIRNYHDQEFVAGFAEAVFQDILETMGTYGRGNYSIVGNYSRKNVVVLDTLNRLWIPAMVRLMGKAANYTAWARFSDLVNVVQAQPKRVVLTNAKALNEYGVMSVLPKSISWRTLPSTERIERNESNAMMEEQFKNISKYLLN